MKKENEISDNFLDLIKIVENLKIKKKVVSGAIHKHLKL